MDILNGEVNPVAQEIARIIPFPKNHLAKDRHTGCPITGWRTIPIPKGHRPGDEYLSPRVCGDSLIGDGILESEFVIIKVTDDQSQFAEGYLVAAQTPNGLIIKHVHFEPSGLICFTLSNPDYDPLFFHPAEVQLVGIAVRHEWDTPDGQTIRVDLSPDGRAQA